MRLYCMQEATEINVQKNSTLSRNKDAYMKRDCKCHRENNSPHQTYGIPSKLCGRQQYSSQKMLNTQMQLHRSIEGE